MAIRDAVNCATCAAQRKVSQARQAALDELVRDTLAVLHSYNEGINK
jgi:hypothetical protein